MMAPRHFHFAGDKNRSREWGRNIVMQQKSVLRSADGVTLADVKIYLLTELVTLQQRFTVVHDGLPFEIGFDNLKDAETFFCIEVQSRKHAQQEIPASVSALHFKIDSARSTAAATVNSVGTYIRIAPPYPAPPAR